MERIVEGVRSKKTLMTKTHQDRRHQGRNC